jgi:hypothetical protein
VRRKYGVLARKPEGRRPPFTPSVDEVYTKIDLKK